ncbi:MAG TPA: hypothetical protein VHW65_05175 [Gemmatimonadales bacterium]|jgi:hypothetical protein|nr:hypothetical protein [Gemmatimonadales bacterium]
MIINVHVDSGSAVAEVKAWTNDVPSIGGDSRTEYLNVRKVYTFAYQPAALLSR